MEAYHDAGYVIELLHQTNGEGGPNHWFPKNVLPLMAYKEFTWEANPTTTTITCEKNLVKLQYPELDAVDLEDMDCDCAIITGEGEFFGPYAYSLWDNLWAQFKRHGPGDFFHPIYKDIKYAVMKKLEGKMEAKENYISYTFEFWEHRPPNLESRIVVPPAVVTPKATTVAPVKKTYTVVEGDCLWNISKKFCGDGARYTEIASANNIKNPDLIYPGQVFVIPF